MSLVWPCDVLACLIAALCVQPVAAQQVGGRTLYRYTNEKGVVVYSDTAINDPSASPADRINSQGSKLKPPVDVDKNAADKNATARAVPDGASPGGAAARPRTREEETEQRRNSALLSTYNSSKEIESSREHALREPLALLRQAQIRMIAAGRVVNRLERESALRPQPGKAGQDARAATAPDAAAEVDNARFELKTQALIAQNKLEEIAVIRAQFDEDLRRYASLTVGSTATAATAATAATTATTATTAVAQASKAPGKP